MRKFERIWMIAVVAGALLAGLPIIIVDRLSNTYVERNAKSHLDSFGHGALGITETRLEQASNLLVDLAKANIADCSVGSVEIMRRAHQDRRRARSGAWQPLRVLLDRGLPDVRVERGGEEDRLLP